MMQIFIEVSACDAANYFTIEATDEEYAVLQKLAKANNHEKVRLYGCHPRIEVSDERPDYGFDLKDSLYEGYGGSEYAEFDAQGELVQMHGGFDEE